MEEVSSGAAEVRPGQQGGQPAPSAARPRLQIAPMMEVTYKDFRQFMRIVSSEVQLWTEMWVDNTLLFAEKVDGFLDFGPNEHPIVCQLGGSTPSSLAAAARVVQKWGYDELNLNCGCPSDRVAGKGEFGASLMKKPELVRDCCRSMAEAAGLPVTVKCRLGVDDDDSPEFTHNFVRIVAEAGVRHFIIHARKCLLNGLTPDQNRRIPPLMYDRVMRLCREFPELQFSLNGGVNSLEEVKAIMDDAPPNLLGVMIGRAAMNNPCALADTDRFLYGRESNPASARSRRAMLEAYCEYLEREHPPGSAACTATGSGAVQGALKPVLGIFHGVPGNKILRQGLDRLSRDKQLRSEGPAAVLRRVMAQLEADTKVAALMDAPLPMAGAPPPAPAAPEDAAAKAERKAAAKAAHEAAKATAAAGAAAEAAAHNASAGVDEAALPRKSRRTDCDWAQGSPRGVACAVGV